MYVGKTHETHDVARVDGAVPSPPQKGRDENHKSAPVALATECGPGIEKHTGSVAAGNQSAANEPGRTKPVAATNETSHGRLPKTNAVERLGGLGAASETG